MKNVHAMLVLLVVLLPLQGQANSKVDSLKQLLHSEVPIDRAEVSWLIAYELFDLDNPQALFYAERAYHDVWKKGDSLQIVKVGTTYSQLLRRAEKLKRSIEIAESLLPISRRNEFNKYTLMLLNSLTLSLTFTEEFVKAFEFGFESLELRRKSGSKFDIAIGLNNMGLLYYKLSDFDNAINCYKECIGIRRELSDTTLLSTTLTNTALAYRFLDQPNTALLYLDSAMALAKSNASRRQLMSVYNALGETNFQMRDYEGAYLNQIKALELANSVGDQRFQLSILTALAEIELKRGNTQASGRYFNRFDQIGMDTEHKQIRITAAKSKSEYFAAVGDMKSAYAEARKYISGRSYRVFELSRDIRQIQHVENQKENLRKLSLQSSILSLQNQTLERQRIFVLSVILLLIFVGFLAFKLYIANRKIKDVNRLLDERVVERTKELRERSDLLQHLVDEHRISGNRFASELFSLVGTLKGLHNLCEAESSTNSQLCLSKATVVVEKIEAIVARLKSPPV